MGKLLKVELARLITLSAAGCESFLICCAQVDLIYYSNADLTWTDQLVAAIVAYFNPKIFFDIWTRHADVLVTPTPFLQTANLLLSLIVLALEWPLHSFRFMSPKQSFLFRFCLLPLTAMAALILYQGTNAALYHIIGLSIYVSAYRTQDIAYIQERPRAGESSLPMQNTPGTGRIGNHVSVV